MQVFLVFENLILYIFLIIIIIIWCSGMFRNGPCSWFYRRPSILNLVKFSAFDRHHSDKNQKINILWLGYVVGIGRITARMPILLSSFHCAAFCFDSYGWNKKVKNLLSWKFKLSLENTSFLAYCVMWPWRVSASDKVMAFPVHCVCKFVLCNFKPKQNCV